MSSINNGIRFIYGGESSDKYGVFLCSSFGSIYRSSNVESRTLVTTNNIFNRAFNLHYVKYDDPLRFDLIIVNSDGTYIDVFKERQLKKWLVKEKRQWLQVIQEDLNDIMFYCMVIRTEIINVGSYSGGMLLSFECDSPWAWTGLKKKTYTCNGTLSFNLNFSFDYDEDLLYPQLKIIGLTGAPVYIRNITTNEEIEIEYVFDGETVNLDCRNDKISSSENRVLLDSWNKMGISFCDGKNEMELEGHFKVEISYRLPVRIGC